MKKFLGIWFLGLGLILLSSCAKPEVVNIILPGDRELNCGQLEDAFAETRRFRKEAEAVRDSSTGGNMTRAFLFWPALLQTIHNVDVAIKAANDRGFHLIDIMKNKNCKKADKFFAELTKTTPSINISGELIRLHKLYRRGVLTEEEFEKAKEKVLSQ